VLKHRIEHLKSNVPEFQLASEQAPCHFLGWDLEEGISGSMDKEGGFVNIPPLLDGANYDYWKSW